MMDTLEPNLPWDARPRIAVIGAGIAGLATAWLLRRTHRVTLFEAESRAGGHALTHLLQTPTGPRAVDMGFIVLNDRNYPNLTAFLAALNVPTHDTEMSFAVSIGQNAKGQNAKAGRFEYGGGTIAQLFAQRRNLLSPRFWRMLRDIGRFWRAAPALLDSTAPLSLGAFLDAGGYGPGFIEDHLLPMGAAIWSTPVHGMRDFPARSFARFFHNHGLLSLTDRPQWQSVAGGSRVYVARVLEDLRAEATVRLDCAVTGIAREPGIAGPDGALGDGIILRTSRGQVLPFDTAVLACHADQALAMLVSPTPAERMVLGAFRCTDNEAVLHSDPALMPKRRRAWSSWNFLAERGGDPSAPVSLTYWMNTLQNLPADPPLFVTLNPRRRPDPALTHAWRLFRHPQFDAAAIAAQDALAGLQGADRLFFAGAWTGWGFHEDGIAAAVRVAEALGATVPWRQPSQMQTAR